MSISISGNGGITGATTGYSFDQSVSIGGTLTYEDVTNIDSVGIITARQGLDTPTDLLLRTGGTEKARIDSSGNFGIATTTPSSFGKFAIRSHAGTIDAVPNVSAHIADGSNSALYIGHSSGLVQLVANSAISFGYTNGTTNSERMRIDSLGRLGLGISSPSKALEVGSASSDIALLRRKNASGGAGLYLSNNSNNGAALVSEGGSGGGFVVYTQSSDVITARMKIDSSGRLLVGTSSTSAGQLLTVQGSVGDATGIAKICRSDAAPAATGGLGILDFSDSGHTTAVRIRAARDGGTWTSGSSQPSALTFSTTADGASSPTERLKIDSSGRVGIGTTPDSRLHVVDGSNNGLRIGYLAGSLNLNLYDASGHVFRSPGGGSEYMRIDSSGRLLVGTSSARAFGGLGTPSFQQEGTGYELASGAYTLNQNTADSPWLILAKSRGSSLGSFTVVNSGDILGRISFQGADGTVFRPGASIAAEVDATPGSGDMPGRLVFSTTADGGSTPTERMRIDSSGNVGIGTTSPNSELEIKNASTSAGLTITTGNTTDDGYINFNDGATAGQILYKHSDNYMRFYVNADERMRIDSSGNVKIGGTLPSAPNITLNADGSAKFAGGNGYSTDLSLGINNSGTIAIRNDTALVSDVFQVYKGGSASNNINLRLRNDGSAEFAGSAKIGTPDVSDAEGKGIELNVGNTSANLFLQAPFNASSSSKIFRVNYGTSENISFTNNGSATFAGTVTASSYVTSSDQRFKENITDANSQLADVTALGNSLRNWDWTADAPVTDKETRFLGLIAQEAETISPGIVATIPRTKNGNELTPEVVVPAVYETRTVPAVLDEEGEVIEPETTEQVLVTEEQVTPATYEQLDDSYKGIKNDVLVMKLLGAVAELSAKVAALEAG